MLNECGRVFFSTLNGPLKLHAHAQFPRLGRYINPKVQFLELGELSETRRGKTVN